VTPGGVVLDVSPIPIATSPGPQYSPSVAFDGTTYMVAWDDHRGSWDQTYVARVNKDGVVLDPSGIAVAASSSHQWFPDISFGPSNYLVAWQGSRDSDDIYARGSHPEGRS
jgi:hypothetical protein